MTSRPRRKILVVEDEDKIARLLALNLERAGYDVHTDAYGKAALDYAGAHQPDLVILDLRLPDIGGYEVCKELRKMYHSWVVPIVMVTGMEQPIDQLRGFAHGADAYLTKPFEMSDLLETMGLLLGEKTSA